MLWNMDLVMKKIGIIVIFLLVILFSSSFGRNIVYSQTDTPTPTPSSTPSSTPNTEELQKKINDLQSKISDLQGQEKTLSSQIAVMDNQIKLTEYRIEATQEQITSLILDIDTTTKKISGLQEALNNLVGVLANRIVATYEVGTIQPFQILLTSNNASDFFKRLNYLKIAQEHDKKLVYDTQQAKVDYANQKVIFEDKKKKIEALKAQLENYTAQLDKEKQAKQDLLVQTQGSEANYQQILAETKAQLAGFQRFVTSQGGASLLSGQTSCDDWGCYYNQRDSQWGGNSLNGTSYTLADSGCLITAVAMIYTHRGYKDVNPQSINSNSGNFGGIPAALLKYSISVNGVSSTRTKIGSSSSALPSSITDPIIVGISYDGGSLPDHFVVLVGGSNGNYMMNDPFTPNGHNIPFTSKYSLGSIVEVDTISM